MDPYLYIDTQVIERIAQLLSEDKRKDFIREMIQLYITLGKAVLPELRKALDAKNIGEVESQAHRLKGSSANIGAKTVAHLCNDIENLASEGKLPQKPHDVLKQLEEAYDKTLQELRSLAGSFR